MITLHGWELSQQMLLSGIVQGLAYAVLGAGIVLVYRASGIINFAVAAFGTTALAFMAVLLGGGVADWHPPFWLAAVLATAAAALVGSLAEWAVIRRLADAPRLVVLVATIGIAQVLLLVALLLPDVLAGGFFPPLLDWTWTASPELLVQGRDWSVLVVIPVLVLLLGVFLTRTRTGLMVRASAANPEKARLVGIRVFRTANVVWAISAALAAVAAIVLAPVRGVSLAGAAAAGGALSYQLLLRALVVALVARMRSLPIALVAGIGVGIVEVILQQNVDPSDLGVTELWLFVATLVIVLVFSRRSQRSGQMSSDDSGWKVTASTAAPASGDGGPWWSRHRGRIGVVALFGALVLLPVFLTRSSESFLWTRVLIFAIAGCSLTILTGWAGQVSLGQFGFAAVGGLVTVKLVGAGFLGLHHLPWGVAVAIGVLVGAAVAVLIGLPALRIPGLYLAVTTLAFAVFVSVWLVAQGTFLDASGLLPTLAKPDAGIVDFASRRSYYYLCLAFLLACVALVAQLRRTGIGRSVIAARDNPASAAGMTISTTRMKLLAFAVSGGMAALAGCLLVTLLPSNTPAVTFAPEESVKVVAIVVIGGLGALVGPVLGALWVVGIPAIWPDEPIVPFLVSGVGILAILLFAPGGLAGILRTLESWLFDRPRAPATPSPSRTGVGRDAHVASRDAGSLDVEGDWLVARGIRVTFGGRIAVDHVDLRVGARELVGLIGTNGAGKSTLMNAIGGFVPATGEVTVLGRDVTGLPAYRRHRLGLGRTFQAARLYDDLTVRETVMVALEARDRSRVVPSMLRVPPSPRAERRKRAEADDILDALGLGETVDQPAAALSTGTRRLVELAGQLALGARVVLLDEPTAGLSQHETEAFGPRLCEIQRDLDAAILLIEHDMPLVMSVSDRVYCLEAGLVIAEGTPDAVRADPLVIASYLGADVGAAAAPGGATTRNAPRMKGWMRQK
jgi:ABC-type branched-subunit amino acid transport system ATPase component/ABC-type branched-subunit amino acid transport system permease subunit